MRQRMKVFSSYKERLKYLSLSSLVYRRMQEDVIHMFKYIHPQFNIDSNNMK